ncbi:MAG: glycoside hydrolase family 25 protein [Ruminococcus sp.]|nr:glycoside hydrolase family 25 protein [Ruminococcus sp.]
MSTVLTNIEFVKKLKDVATNYKTLYVMGCFGAPMNAANKTRYCDNHSYNKQSARTAMIKAATDDTFGFDCVCLIKGILWGWNGDKSKVYGGATYKSNDVPDIGADTMITQCTGVSTNFSNIEVGEAVWMTGHIGVYIGDGLAVECTPAWDNKVQITACNCDKSGYNRRNWTKHGKLPYIKYEAVSDTAPATNKAETSASGVKGVDVSKWQGDIDWNKVKADGIKFAMIRLGYGSADGNSCGLDGYFEKNVTNAIKAGIDIGCYFYSYATSVEAAKKEAQYVVGVLSKYKGTFTYPVAFDIEDKSQVGLGKTTLTNMVIAFGDIIEKAGFYCSVYSNLNWLKNYLDDSKIKRFDHWLAQWSSAPTYSGAFGMWQNSSTGKVNGISGNVDTDIAYKDYPTAIKSGKLNGFTNAVQKPTAPVAPQPSQPQTPATPAE